MASILEIQTKPYDPATLEFEIQMIDYVLPDETTEAMSDQERIEWACSLKERGNVFFTRGEEFAQAAMLKYLRILWVLVRLPLATH